MLLVLNIMLAKTGAYLVISQNKNSHSMVILLAYLQRSINMECIIGCEDSHQNYPDLITLPNLFLAFQRDILNRQLVKEG